MKGPKENRQDEKGKLERLRLAQARSFHRNSPKRAQSRPDKITPVELGFFSSNLPKRKVT